jgi:hypothetical protein
LSHCIVQEKTDPAFCDRYSNSNFDESVNDLSHEAFNCRMTNREFGLQYLGPLHHESYFRFRRG